MSKQRAFSIAVIRIVRVYGLPIAIGIYFFLLYINIVNKIPIQYWDEHDWIGRTYYFDLLATGHFDDQLWDTIYAYEQPKLVDYLYGFSLYSQYKLYSKQHTVDYVEFLIDHNFYEIDSEQYEAYKNSSTTYIDWGKDPSKIFGLTNSELTDMFGIGIHKTISIIHSARKVNVLLLSATLIFIYSIHRTISNTSIAAVSTTLTGLNYLFVTSGLRAHSEGLFLFLFFFSFYLLINYFKSLYRNSPLFLVMFATVLALITQTKLNGALFLLFLLAANCLVIIKDRAQKKYENVKKIIRDIILIALVFCVVFVALHPSLYKNPIYNTLFLFSHRWDIVNAQIHEFPPDYLSSPTERLVTLYSNFFGDPSVCQYTGFITADSICRTNSILKYAYGFLFLIGTLFFSWRSVSMKDTNKMLYIALFFFLVCALLYYLKLNWDRYFIHLVPFVYFFITYGAYTLGKEFAGVTIRRRGS